MPCQWAASAAQDLVKKQAWDTHDPMPFQTPLTDGMLLKKPPRPLLRLCCCGAEGRGDGVRVCKFLRGVQGVMGAGGRNNTYCNPHWPFPRYTLRACRRQMCHTGNECAADLFSLQIMSPLLCLCLSFSMHGGDRWLEIRLRQSLSSCTVLTPAYALTFCL